METPLISIIVRTKNEEKLIDKCLSAVFNQSFKDFEVIVVDSGSQDKTLELAKQYPVKIIEYRHIDNNFKPGRALNLGIQNSSGKYIVMLSAHCVPENEHWIDELLEEIRPAEVAGVYGKQRSTEETDNVDKLDLLLFFGPERLVQKKGSFFYFHNANSMIKRTIWEQVPFDEELRHYEKIPWARKVVNKGYTLIYTPKAAVSHWHGIHQHIMGAERAKERAGRIVGILEQDFREKKIAGIIPVKGQVKYLGKRPLIEYTILRALASKSLNLVAVTTDNPEVADIARNLGVHHIFIYPPELTEEHVEIGEILKYGLCQFEKMGIRPDVIAYLSPTYPFRPKDLIDRATAKLIEGNYDSVLAVLPEFRSCWTIEESGKINRLDKGFIPSQFKKPVFVGTGLADVFCSDNVRKSQNRLGEKIGLLELDNVIYSIDTGKAQGDKIAESLINDWWLKNQ